MAINLRGIQPEQLDYPRITGFRRGQEDNPIPPRYNGFRDNGLVLSQLQHEIRDGSRPLRAHRANFVNHGDPAGRLMRDEPKMGSRLQIMKIFEKILAYESSGFHDIFFDTCFGIEVQGKQLIGMPYYNCDSGHLYFPMFEYSQCLSEEFVELLWKFISILSYRYRFSTYHELAQEMEENEDRFEMMEEDIPDRDEALKGIWDHIHSRDARMEWEIMYGLKLLIDRGADNEYKEHFHLDRWDHHPLTDKALIKELKGTMPLNPTDLIFQQEVIEILEDIHKVASFNDEILEAIQEDGDLYGGWEYNPWISRWHVGFDIRLENRAHDAEIGEMADWARADEIFFFIGDDEFGGYSALDEITGKLQSNFNTLYEHAYRLSRHTSGILQRSFDTLYRNNGH